MSVMDGIIVVNKSAGKTSFEVVKVIRRLSGERRVGHAGTLDPSATGVLPVCLGKATHLVSLLMDGEKEYEGELVLGIKTDTQDADGKIIQQKEVRVARSDLDAVVPEFTGEIDQIPPMVSALHYQGKRLYELARQGLTVERKPRKIRISKLEILKFDEGVNPRASFRVRCSRGTYVRTLCTDIGDRLGCGAHQSKLIRVRSGPFILKEAKTLEELQLLKEAGRFLEAVLSIEAVRHAIQKEKTSQA